MNSRVREIRKELKLSQTEFGGRLGITGAGISKIEAGHRHLTDQMVLLICKEFNVSEQWLRLGQGDMFRQPLPFSITQLTDYYHLDELDSRIINEYLMLEPKQRKVIKEYITRIAGQTPTSRIDFLDDDLNPGICAEGPADQENRSI